MAKRGRPRKHPLPEQITPVVEPAKKLIVTEAEAKQEQTNVSYDLQKELRRRLEAKKAAEKTAKPKPIKVPTQEERIMAAQIEQVKLDNVQHDRVMKEGKYGMFDAPVERAMADDLMGQSLAMSEAGKEVLAGEPERPEQTANIVRTIMAEQQPRVVKDMTNVGLPPEADTLNEAQAERHHLHVAAEGQVAQAQEHLRQLADLLK